MTEPLADWLKTLFGRLPGDLAPFERALTHGSLTEHNYERLEFLGDRVLGLAIAEWLYELYPAEPEGMLSRRTNALVSGATCAEIAREIGVPAQLRLGKGARASLIDSDNVLGDVVESLLAAWYLQEGFAAARLWVRARWADRVRGDRDARKHPKAELQEWSEAHGCGLPVYTVLGEEGADHARRYTVAVRVGDRGEESAVASTKREAEAVAAAALIGRLRATTPVRRRRRGPPTGVARRAP